MNWLQRISFADLILKNLQLDAQALDIIKKTDFNSKNSSIKINFDQYQFVKVHHVKLF